MTTPAIIGQTKTVSGGVYGDRPTWQVVVVPSSGGSAIVIDTIESFETEKSDNGDAGTFHFTCPLRANLDLAAIISPMDMVAIYAARNSSAYGNTSTTPDTTTFGAVQPVSVADLVYGSTEAKTTWMLGYPPTCLMIGMVDGHEESMDEEQASASLSVWGRDLTKIFIDNDLAVPQMDPAGGAGGTYLQISNIAINEANSGTQMLLNILDAFTGKSPAAMAQITGEAAAGFQSIAQFGYPWRNYVRTDALVSGFKTFATGVNPLFPAAGGGSTWVNAMALKNEPLARLFVNEIGQLIFDDAFSAWGFGEFKKPTTATITKNNIRQRKWTRDDASVKTAMAILLAQGIGGEQQILYSLQQSAIRSNAISLIQKYGFRYFAFTSQFDPIDTTAAFLNELRFPVLMADANDIWRGEITVAGDPRYRVGMRVLIKGVHTGTLDLGLMATTQGMGWYVEKVRHHGSWGSDYATDLSLRFSSASLAPADPQVQVSGNPTGVT